MSTFSNENHVTRGFTSDAINEFAFRLRRGIYFSLQKRLKHGRQSITLRSGICDGINRYNIFLFMQPF
jgi:hypothetical protein